MKQIHQKQKTFAKQAKLYLDSKAKDLLMDREADQGCCI